jgi:hypothetical protein
MSLEDLLDYGEDDLTKSPAFFHTHEELMEIWQCSKDFSAMSKRGFLVVWKSMGEYLAKDYLQEGQLASRLMWFHPIRQLMPFGAVTQVTREEKRSPNSGSRLLSGYPNHTFSALGDSFVCLAITKTQVHQGKIRQS